MPEQLHLLLFDGFCLPQKQILLPQAFEFDIPIGEDILPKRLWVGLGVVLLGVNPNSILAKIIE